MPCFCQWHENTVEALSGFQNHPGFKLIKLLTLYCRITDLKREILSRLSAFCDLITEITRNLYFSWFSAFTWLLPLHFYWNGLTFIYVLIFVVYSKWYILQMSRNECVPYVLLHRQRLVFLIAALVTVWLHTSNTVLTVFDLFPAKRKRSNQEFQVFLKTRITLSVKL